MRLWSLSGNLRYTHPHTASCMWHLRNLASRSSFLVASPRCSSYTCTGHTFTISLAQVCTCWHPLVVPGSTATQTILTAQCCQVQGLKASLQAAGIVISGELNQEQLVACPICFEEYMSQVPPPRCEACLYEKSGACKACRAKASVFVLAGPDWCCKP